MTVAFAIILKAVKIVFELGAVFVFLILVSIVVVFGALVTLLDGTLTPFGC